MSDAMLTLKEAAALLGLKTRTLECWNERGKLSGVVKVPMGAGLTREIWMVPADRLATLCPNVRKPRPERLGANANSRCNCCGILLAHSGDDWHANDAPDARRCWYCRKEYGGGS